MKKHLALLLLAAACLAMSPRPPDAQAAEPSTYFGATRVIVTQAHVSTSTEIRAFVPTGTLNEHCLVTLAESTFPVAGMTVFCAPREPAELGKGVLISIFHPVELPAEFLHVLTIFQEGALRYGAPVFCGVLGC